jgi:AcrR family transcriptional regulator
MQKKKRNPEKRREEIIAAALDLFSQNGYQATSIRAIAKKAGVTEGLIYHYFRDKRDLVLSIIETVLKQRDQLIMNIDFNQPADKLLENTLPKAKLLMTNEYFKKSIRFLWTQIPTFSREELMIVSARVDVGLQIVANIMRMKMDSGEVKKMEPYLVSRMLVGSFIAYFVLQEMIGLKEMHDIDPADYMAVVLEIFKNGMLTDDLKNSAAKRKSGNRNKKGNKDE